MEGYSTLCQFRRTLAYKPLRSRRRFTIFFLKLRFLAYISGAAERTFAKLLPMVDLGCVQIPQYVVHMCTFLWLKVGGSLFCHKNVHI